MISQEATTKDVKLSNISQDRNFILLVSMINRKHVYFYWGGPLLFGPPNAYLWGSGPPPTPPGIDAPGKNTLWLVVKQF